MLRQRPTAARTGAQPPPISIGVPHQPLCPIGEVTYATTEATNLNYRKALAYLSIALLSHLLGVRFLSVHPLPFRSVSAAESHPRQQSRVTRSRWRPG